MGVYVEGPDFKSGKDLREQFKAGKEIRVYQPGPFGPQVKDGDEVIEFPKYPKPHQYYVGVVVKDGKVVKVRR